MAAIFETISQRDEFVEKTKIFTQNRVKNLKELKANICDWGAIKDDFLFVQYTNAPNDFSDLCDMLAEGFFAEMVVECLVVVLFVGYIPNDISSRFTIVIPVREVSEFLETAVKKNEFQSLMTENLMLPMTFYNLLYEKKYREFMEKPFGEDEEVIYSGALIMAAMENKVDRLEEICTIVKSKIELSENAKNMSDIPALFVDILYQSVTKFPSMITIQEASECVDFKGDNILFTDDFYYFPSSVMGTIMLQMSKFAGREETKKALADAGYLDVQGIGRNYYTQKLLVRGGRYAFYKLWREKIDRPGEISLLNIKEAVL